MTVSISDFRDDISGYLERVKRGDLIVIKDEKKGVPLAEVTAIKKFDANSYLRAMKKAAGTFTAKNHPEWATRSKVEKWLRSSRMNDERNFDVRP